MKAKEYYIENRTSDYPSDENDIVRLMEEYHQSQIQALKEGINNRIVQLELLIEQKDYESQFLSIKESRIDELKKVFNLITNLDDK